MRVQKVRYPIIGIMLSMFLLAGCGVSAEPPTASPSAMPTEARITLSPEPTEVVVTEVVSSYCTDFIIVNVEAYFDQNENGTWDPAETPLEGVSFWTSN
jgi:hypothetical protein